MKVFKSDEHALLVKPFGIRDRNWLAVTVMFFWDLDEPDRLLTEQDLWTTLPGALGELPVLDVGMPKPRGEVLVTGRACAPRGETRLGVSVSFRVGKLGKRLEVFGDRYWRRNALGMSTISEPVPFSELPVTWANAFGGPGDARNPAGKGLRETPDPEGRPRLPLPNVEHPGSLVGSPVDRPAPAGFGPLEVTWPPRSEKAGTYGERWLRERWPHFPDDMNYEFFNTAPEDQWVEFFFQGDETIEIINMHPDRPRLQSRLPRRRPRCFLTLAASLDPASKAEDVFREVECRIDTVCLFPTIRRGMCIHRGLTEILDDEYADVHRLFLATEDTGEEPKSIEHYLAEQEKALNLSVAIDPGPLEEARQQVAKTRRRSRNLPKKIAEIKRQAMGRTPAMTRTPDDMRFLAGQIADRGRGVLDSLESLARRMHAEYGHLVEIDLEQFDRWRAKIDGMVAEVDRSAGKLDEARQEVLEKQKELAGVLKRNVRPEQLQQAGVDPERFESELAPKINPWHDRGFPLVKCWRRHLEQSPEAGQALAELGLEEETIRRAWLGYNVAGLTDDPSLWGLVVDRAGPARNDSSPPAPGEGMRGQPPPEPVQIPAGLVLPRFDGPVLNRVLVLSGWPGEALRAARAVLVPGSDQSPLFLPAATEGAPVIRVASELEALLMEQEVGDACAVMALEALPASLPEPAEQALKSALSVLVVMPAAEAGREDTAGPWRHAWPTASILVLPAGETVFEARAAGVDLRRWVLEALPADWARAHDLERALPAPGEAPDGDALAALAVPPFDIKGVIEQTIGEIRAFHQPAFDALLAKKGEALEQAKAALASLGPEAGEVKAAAGQMPPLSFGEAAKTIAGQIARQRDRCRELGALSPEQDRQFESAIYQAQSMGEVLEDRYGAAMARLQGGQAEMEAGLAKLRAGELPDKAKELFSAAGMDPDRIKRRSREEVIAMHGRGESLAGAILSGVDLSGLDLHGIDLTGAICEKTNFSGSNLDGSDLGGVVAMESDWSGASLRGARINRGILPGARMIGTRLNEAILDQTSLDGADLSDADLTGSRLKMVTLQKARLCRTCFKQARAELSVFEGEAEAVDFGQASFLRCILSEISLDRANFEGATLNATLLWQARGEQVSFRGANLDQGRMGGQVDLPAADFRGVHMEQACFRDASLVGACFRKSVLIASLFENCDLREADLRGVQAREARFQKTNLERARLYGINLFQGSLRKSRLVEADLRRANLGAVDFYKAVFGKTRLDGANLKLSQLQNRTEFLP